MLCLARLMRCAMVASGTRNAFATSAVVKDRKSTRLNSSHSQISYAVFCLKETKSRSTSNCFSDDVRQVSPEPDLRPYQRFMAHRRHELQAIHRGDSHLPA